VTAFFSIPVPLSRMTVISVGPGISFTRGALTASKTQLAPGDEIPVSSPYHVILALSDLDLSKQVSGKRAEALEMSAEDARILPGGSDFKLVNTGQRPGNVCPCGVLIICG
jgi:hypothetical protein